MPEMRAKREQSTVPAERPGLPNRPWTSLYPAHIEPEMALDHDDVPSLFRDCVTACPEHIAIHYFDRSYTYRAVDLASDALAVWMQQRGVVLGDRIAIIAQNIPGFIFAALAAWKAAAVPVPINPMYRARELSKILSDAEPRLIVCQEAEVAEVTVALANITLNGVTLLVMSPADGQGSNDSRVLPPIVKDYDGERLNDVLAQFSGRRPPPASSRPDALGLILYTSGTTGQPKGAMLAQRSLAFNAQFTRDWCGLGPDTRILAIAPFFHITGIVCHMCAAFSARGAVILNYRFEPRVALDMIRIWRPTFTIGAITAFTAFTRLSDITHDDMSSFRQVFSGGAPIPKALLEQIQRHLGITIKSSFGMTETAAPATFALPTAPVPSRDGAISIGLPIPSTDIRVADEFGNAAPAGVEGELLIRGPQVMLGYWRKAEESAAALKDGWMHSGDIGFMDEAGWVYLLDRKKDVIIASGFKVWPREVEDVLYAHPDVREVAVVGVPDDYRGETVKAVVSLRPTSATTVSELLAHCVEQLAAYKVPRIIEFMEELPKTVSGKIQRAALRSRLPS